MVNDNLFFCKDDYSTKLFLIKENDFKELNHYDFSLDLDESSAIDLSEDFLALNSYNIIYLLYKKNNYSYAKTILLDFPSFIHKINDYIVSIFIKGEQMKLINYDISLKGIKWKPRKTKIVINEKIYYYNQINKNYILFIGKTKCYFYEIQLNQKNN